MPKILHKFRIPLIGVSLPEISLPDEFPPKPPKLDERQVEALRYAIQDDVADLIPVVGDVGSDLAFKELTEKLTPEEYKDFLEVNKLLPSSLSVLKIFSEKAK